jgi:thioredoxin reductase (NADPH)
LYYGAGAREASLCGNEPVFIVGGGNSAGQAAMHFSRVAKKVAMVIRGDSLKSTLSSYLIDQIRSAPNIEVLTSTEVTKLDGDQCLRTITLTSHRTGISYTYETRWLSVCIGGLPNTRWAEEVGVIRDEAGYLVTGPDLLSNGHPPQGWPLDRPPYYLETNLPGLFAAGDVLYNSIKRCASVVSEGAMAISFVHRYLSSG